MKLLKDRNYVLMSEFTVPNMYSEQMTRHLREKQMHPSRGKDGCTKIQGKSGHGEMSQNVPLPGGWEAGS